MKTKNIFKTLVLAAVLVSACSKNDIADDFKGYTLPVTINVTRQGDAATRATYDGDTKKLSFSTGDKLFVAGSDSKAGDFAGLLAWQSKGTFSGTIMTENEYTGTAEELLSSATDPEALLIPAGYESYEYFELEEITPRAGYFCYPDKAFALTKAAAVEQFSFELAEAYSSGFTLSPQNAIVSFSISGLTANKEVAVSFDTNGTGVISGNVTTNATGVATFAVGVLSGCTLEDCTLTVDGNNIAMPTKTTEAGHIYNISRSAAPATDLSTISANYTAQNGETLTGTLTNNVKISIADGATVILKDVTINGENNSSYKWAGITCAGDANITLEGTNTVKGFYEDYPGIQVPVDKTLTIQGTGSLNASSNGYGAGIGGGYEISCGNIVIKGGTINANGGGGCSGIGIGTGDLTCGTITISGGDITANGGTNGAGIGIGGGGSGASSCGAITISGGTVKATGGNGGAGIGSGHNGGFGASTCGTITISGGTVEATGGSNAAGIGSGHNEGAGTSSCGTITITSGVNSVTATKGSGAPNSIGAGKGSSEITVKIEDPSKVTQN